MNPNRSPILLIAALGLFAASSTVAAEDARPSPITVAVLDFAAGEEARPGQGAEAAALLAGLLSASDDFVLVERSELEKVLGEMELGLSGTVPDGSAARVGQLTGAKILVTGRMFASGEESHLLSKVISVETGRVFGQSARFHRSEGFAGAVEGLAEKIAITLAERRSDLLPQRENPEDRLARLKAMVAGKNLPKVFVRIPEQHLSREVPDPAAETEVLLALQDAGYPLADSSEAAEVVVTGEAFSEMAGRRANLVSCRARVEVKVARKAMPGSLAVDRQTSVAVDLAENIAAKSALQEAGRQIGERLAASLAK